jgi:hypothetical protein
LLLNLFGSGFNDLQEYSLISLGITRFPCLWIEKQLAQSPI